MLTLSTREQYTTLLDAVTLRQANERPAIIYVAADAPPVVVSRRAFAATTAATAVSLHELGLRPRDLVVIAHTQNLESIFAFWGALRLGAIPAMFPTLTEKLDPDVYMRGMAELARLSAVAAVLTTDDFAPVLRPRLPCPVYGSSDWKKVSRQDAKSAKPGLPGLADFASWRETSSPGEIAFLQHSSGTTGLQKGVALSHAAVLNQVAAYSDTLSLREDEVVVSWLPLYHDMGLIAGFLLPLIQGLPLILMSPFDWVQHPALLFRAIHDHRATLCWLPNFAYNHCARRIRRRDSEGLSAASMRLFVNCSEPVRHDSHSLFLERFAANGVRPEMLGVSYAMAENTFAVTQTPPGRPARLDYVDPVALAAEGFARPIAARQSAPTPPLPPLTISPSDYANSSPDVPAVQPRVSCGPPIPNTELRVLDDDAHPLPDRFVGQLAIRSNCLLSGYYRRDDLQPFTPDGWFLTGDRGYVTEGEVYVVGRAKDLIINAGKNIYPGDIEAIVNEVAGVHAGRAVAFGVADEREGTELIAVVAETRATDAAERQAIARAIRAAVAQQAAVTASYVHLVGPRWLLKTSSGKLARAANRNKWLQEKK